MTYTIVDAAQEGAIGEEGRLRDALGVSAFGIFQVELPPGGETTMHDHADDQAEDVYAVLRGEGWIIVDGVETVVRPGQFVLITPDSKRHVRAGKAGLGYIAVCGS